MRNLLLEEDKKKLRKEYWLRVLLVSLLFLFFTTAVGLIFLFPSYFISRTKEEVINKQAELTEQSIAIREREASATALSEAKEKVELLNERSELILLSEVFETIIHARPDGVFLSSIAFRELGEKKNETMVTGFALRRDQLLSFERALEGNDLFTEVDLPISNLASDRDIEFTIRLQGAF